MWFNVPFYALQNVLQTMFTANLSTGTKHPKPNTIKTRSNRKILNNHARKLLKDAETEPNETKAFYTIWSGNISGLFYSSLL